MMRCKVLSQTRNCHPEQREGPAFLPRMLAFCGLAIFAFHALAQTTITITSQPLHTGVQRFGINLSGQTYYDSGQLLRNLVSRNPGFEGETWQTILHCKTATS